MQHQKGSEMQSAQERKDEAQAKYDAEMNFPGRPDIENRRIKAQDELVKKYMVEHKALQAAYEAELFALWDNAKESNNAL